MGCMHLGKKILIYCVEFAFKDVVIAQTADDLSWIV